jgi:hypothetical protein
MLVVKNFARQMETVSKKTAAKNTLPVMQQAKLIEHPPRHILLMLF